MVLTAGLQNVALKLAEQATRMCTDDVQKRLSKAVYAIGREAGEYCYLCAVFGDDQSGDVVYSCGYDGKLLKAPYAMTATATTVDATKAVEVMPLTTYEPQTGTDEAVEATEAGARNSRRDLAQLQAIHDAAASLGAGCKVKGKESDPAAPVSREASEIRLQESTAFAADLDITEAAKTAGGLKVKIIAPGKGSTAFYTAEVLQRDGPKVFRSGTPMRIDHPTIAEESARPEGSVKDWGAVLASDAVWMDEGVAPAGAGLYASLKPFSDHEATIREKGPFAGVSIRAQGTALMEGGRPVMREGVPVLASFTSAEGVDMVTRAGAGGLFLSESSRKAQNTPNEVTNEMDEATRLAIAEAVRAGIAAEVAPLRARAVKGDATVIGLRVLGSTALSEAQRGFVIDSVTRPESLPLTEAGVLDETKFEALLIAEARRYAATLPDSSIVRNMGIATPSAETQLTEAQIEAREAAHRSTSEAEAKAEVALFETLMGDKRAAQFAAEGRKS